jgi:hypothetical protein
MYSNCLFFALKKFVKKGGYFIIRKSRHGFWFHFMWADDLKDANVEHFVPFNKLKYPWISKVLFKGRIKKNESN